MRIRLIGIVVLALLLAGAGLAIQTSEKGKAAPTLNQLGSQLRRFTHSTKTFEGTGSATVRSRVAITTPPADAPSQSLEFVRAALKDSGFVFKSEDGAINGAAVCVGLDTRESYLSFPGRLPAERQFVEEKSRANSVIVTMLFC